MEWMRKVYTVRNKSPNTIKKAIFFKHKKMAAGMKSVRFSIAIYCQNRFLESF